MAFETLTELKPQGSKIIDYMKAKGYKIRALNIVYLEGIGTDLVKLNPDRLNEWNDVRCVISDTGDVLMACEATTEPGDYYTFNRMNPKGAARIAFGQYLECWRIGLHFTQDALVQCGTIRVHRDNDENGYRTGDTVDTGDSFYINQHTTSNAPNAVGRWSAGCLVGRYPGTHRLFMAICRAMGLTKFDTTVIDGSDFVGFCRVS
jgi:hypothetical protein